MIRIDKIEDLPIELQNEYKENYKIKPEVREKCNN